MDSIKFQTIEEYIQSFPIEKRTVLEKLNAVIASAAPMAKPVISYNMPAYKLNGILLYFAAHEKHIGFYPTANAIVVFQKKLKGYNTSKGTIQLPLNQEMPYDLIREIVDFRVAENLAKTKSKKK